MDLQCTCTRTSKTRVITDCGLHGLRAHPCTLKHVLNREPQSNQQYSHKFAKTNKISFFLLQLFILDLCFNFFVRDWETYSISRVLFKFKRLYYFFLFWFQTDFLFRYDFSTRSVLSLRKIRNHRVKSSVLTEWNKSRTKDIPFLHFYFPNFKPCGKWNLF